MIGIEYLSAALKSAGHEVDILVKGYDRHIIKSAIESDADIIAFSCTTGVHNWVLEVARKIKAKSDKYIVLGGPHPTFFPEIIHKPQVDIICMGEGEDAIVELADRITQKKKITNIKNLWVKKNGKVFKNKPRILASDLSKLDRPDRSIYYRKYSFLRNNPRKPIFTGRGCPYQCTFCFNHAFQKLYKGKGKHVRQRSVNDVIDEIKEIQTKYHLEIVYFLDDIFILNHQWVKEFLKVYKEKINLPFICHIRANLVNEEIIKVLKNGGCRKIFFGIESGNEYIRNKILKKGITNKQIIYTGKLLKKYGIKFRTYNMLGLPGETLENAFETVYINRKIKTDYPWCSILYPYPGTELWDMFVKKGKIPSTYSLDNFGKSFFFSSNFKQSTEIINLQKMFIYTVKFPFLEPLVRKLIKLKPNPFFNVAFLIAHSYIFVRSESQPVFRLSSLKFGLKLVTSFFRRG